jgi:pyridoxamine 5'-phosphate oxidase
MTVGSLPSIDAATELPLDSRMSIIKTIRAFVLATRGVLGGYGLPRPEAGGDPIELFRTWWREAEEAGLLLPEAVSLATATPDGRPSVRLVLLKGVSAEGFVFFSNYGSRKAEELEANPRAALAFHWAALQRSVRVEGQVEKVTPEESEAYFRTRARGSRLGAWASRQSQPIASRAALEAKVDEARKRFGDGEIPLPPFWGGYQVIPERIEFWQGRADRLHDRVLHTRTAEGWRAERLQP